MWTLAHASKAARAKQLQAWLSAKRTAGIRITAPGACAAPFRGASEDRQGQFQGQSPGV
jgi:hypothetical protein